MSTDAKAQLRERRERVFTPGRRHSSAREVVHAFTREIDDILRGLFAKTVDRWEAFAQTSLVALGGYGRGEMCPYSDIDILLLHDGNVPKAAFEAFTRDLWDLGASVGCVVRTMGECTAILGEDPATDNAMLDCSHVAGREELFRHLVSNVLNPYFRRRQRAFLADICRELHDRVYSSVNTLYRVEPDLKSGFCALRDCQRMIWAERVYDTTVGGRRTPGFHLLGVEGKKGLLAAYESLLKLRVELHMVAGRRLDLLELGLQPEIAANMGFADGDPAALMEDYFRAVTEVRHTVHLFLEQAPRATRVWDAVRRTLGAYPAGPGISVVDGILFQRWGRPPSRQSPVLWMLEVFKSALTCHAVLSIGLRNTIRRMVRELTPADFRKEEVDRGFREIISRYRHVGRILQLMHETTFLEGLIPEFGQLTCRVEYDSYHEYTVDQHILLALCALDEMAQEKDPLVLNVYLHLPRKPLLRLGLLLHDIGKALPGNHSRTGAAIAENVALRLGFDEDETSRIRFLVYNHLAMSELSLRREPEEELIREFAERVGDEENLDMLFLLTVLDIRHVGSRTWTGWKAAQLKDVYQRTAAVLREESRRPLDADEVPPGFDAASYLRHALPEEREDHRRWLASLAPGELQFHTESLVGFDRLTVVSHDRKGFLSDFVGCLFAEGLWVVQARIHSTTDGRVLDVFDLECDGATAVPFEKRLAGVRKRWEAVCAGTAQAEAMAEERRRRYPQKASRATDSRLEVTLDNEISGHHTVLEVDVPDSSGLLHRLARELAKLDVVIASARIATLIDQVEDVFYITDTDGRKITDPAMCERIRAKVIELCTS
jgi:[protein-PII] uridylyltransferase